MNKLNIGSGQRKFGEGWTNIDVNPKWEPDILANCSAMPQFADGTVDIIVAHHVLEHFGCGEAAGMIRESYRVLKPGGSLIITVPDMAELFRAWHAGRLETQVFMTAVYGAYMDSEADRHRWGYDWKSLYRFLRETTYSWRRIERFNWREIEGADIAQDFWILGVEAVK